MYLSKACRHMGALTKREVPIPELLQTTAPLPTYDDIDFNPLEQEHSVAAVMDVVAYLPTGEEFLLDASIRNPLAQKYSSRAFYKPGHAAVTGEADKARRYPPTKGKHVIPCVVESFGRLGPKFLAFLDTLIHHSSVYNADLSTVKHNLRDELLTDINATINKIIAKTTHLAQMELLQAMPPPQH